METKSSSSSRILVLASNTLSFPPDNNNNPSNNHINHTLSQQQNILENTESTSSKKPLAFHCSLLEPVKECYWPNCTSVAANFNNELELYQHVLDSHVLRGKQTCFWTAPPENVACGTHFLNRGNFTDHIISHFSNTMKPYECQVKKKRVQEGFGS
jgi:hypothetical protein